MSRRGHIKYKEPDEAAYDGGTRKDNWDFGYDPYRVAHKTFKIGSLFYLMYSHDLFWFRFIGGWGIHAKSVKSKRLILFSERMGLRKTVTFLGWKFRILKPNGI